MRLGDPAKTREFTGDAKLLSVPRGPFVSVDAGRDIRVNRINESITQVDYGAESTVGIVFLDANGAPELRPPARIDNLVAVIEKKLASTRTPDGRHRLAFVDAGMATTLEERTRLEQAVRAKLIGGHALIAGVILLRRVWLDKANRWQYQVLPVVDPAIFDAREMARIFGI
jgi:hypothetical protein